MIGQLMLGLQWLPEPETQARLDKATFRPKMSLKNLRARFRAQESPSDRT